MSFGSAAVLHQSNLYASWKSRAHKLFSPSRGPEEHNRKLVDLWEFIEIDSRPTFIVEKHALEKALGSELLPLILYQNGAFSSINDALDMNSFHLKLLRRPMTPFYMAGRLWNMYLISEGRQLVVTGELQSIEDATLMVGGGLTRSSVHSPGHPMQHVFRETRRSGFPARDRLTSSNPLLDWTRPSVSIWLPAHYRSLHSINWKLTSLGPMSSWSESFRMMVNVVMRSQFPMALLWGTRYIAIYNEAYKEIIGRRHPGLLGEELSKGWPLAWETIGAALDRVRMGAVVHRMEDKLPVDRHEWIEESFSDWHASPVLERAGVVGGVLFQQQETTFRVLMNRRLQTLKTMRSLTASARTVEQFWPLVLEAFDGNTYDSPFILLYEVLKGNENEGILVGTRGFPPNHKVTQQVVVIADGEWLFSAEVLRARATGRKVVKEDLTHYHEMQDVLIRGFKEPCLCAAIIPVIESDAPGISPRLQAFMIIGLNPRRPFNNDYEIWIDQIQSRITAYFAGVIKLETEFQEEMNQQLEAMDRRRASELSAKLMELELELRQTELKFTKMAEVISIGMVELDIDGETTFSNDAFNEIMMLPSDAKKSWMESIYKPDRDFAMENFKRALAGESVRIELRIVDFRNGEYEDKVAKWVIAEIVPVHDDNNHTIAFYKTVTDITPIKNAEEMQKRRAEEAILRAQQQERFIDMTCHELRNPLSAILQSADLMNVLLAHYQPPLENAVAGTSLDIDGLREACSTIVLCVMHQRRIIDDILVTSKLDSNLLAVHPVDIRPDIYIKNALRIFENDMNSKGIKYKYIVDRTYSDAEVEWLKLDPSRLLQILANLITNAIKFTTGRPEKLIEVRLGASVEVVPHDLVYSHFKDPGTGKDEELSEDTTSGDGWGTGQVVYLIASVKDSGIGMKKDDVANLFQRFRQAPKTESKYGGSGLGLYICQNLARIQGGAISVTSEEDKGTEFTFYIKCRRGEMPAESIGIPQFLLDLEKGQQIINSRSRSRTGTSPSPNPDSPPPPAKEKIVEGLERGTSPVAGFSVLVVEDNIINQKMLKKQLEANLCRAFVANNGQEAINFIKRTKQHIDAEIGAEEIEICMMDVEMPVMNGLDASRKIRALEQSGELIGHLPILGVSANARQEQVREMQAAGMDAVLTKPFRIAELLEKAALLVKRRDLESWNSKTESSVPSGDLSNGDGNEANAPRLVVADRKFSAASVAFDTQLWRASLGGTD